MMFMMRRKTVNTIFIGGPTIAGFSAPNQTTMQWKRVYNSYNYFVTGEDK
jgi:hypothetical protein